MADVIRFAFLIEPPFNFRTAEGVLTGSDIALARTAAAAIGHDVQFIEAAFADLLPGLSAGRWDMTTGLFVTAERMAVAAFSRPIWALPDGILVRRGNPAGIAGYRTGAAATGFRMAVVSGQVQAQDARRAGFPEARLVMCSTYEAAAQAVADGRADGYASVERAHLAYLSQNADLALEVITVATAEKSPAPGCFGFRRDSEKLRRCIDAFLDDHIGSVAHRQMMAGFGFSDAEIDLVTP